MPSHIFSEIFRRTKISKRMFKKCRILCFIVFVMVKEKYWPNQDRSFLQVPEGHRCTQCVSLCRGSTFSLSVPMCAFKKLWCDCCLKVCFLIWHLLNWNISKLLLFLPNKRKCNKTDSWNRSRLRDWTIDWVVKSRGEILAH